MNENLSLRLFFEAQTESEALDFVNTLLPVLSESGRVIEKIIQKYWKIPEYFEIFFHIETEEMSDSYSKVLKELGTGWNELNQYESVWNDWAEGKLLDKRIKWAHLEAIEDIKS